MFTRIMCDGVKVGLRFISDCKTDNNKSVKSFEMKMPYFDEMHYNDKNFVNQFITAKNKMLFDDTVKHDSTAAGLFVEAIHAEYDEYDVSYEAYIWLDDTGHGANGAPYDMKDVYEDMEACKDMLWELYDDLHDFFYAEIYKED